ncbi:MAG: sensor histidine kinase, partial [Polyangiales bacterium]
LRHELSNQIVAVSTSIDLAKSDGTSFGSETYLERAQRSLGRMRGLVSSATEATSLEAALAMEETERVDLSGVVMDRVTAFQELHPSRDFTLKLRPGLSIDGNEARIAQLLDKLLGNAVEHALSDAEIRVALEVAGDGWLEVSVENEGDALPEDRTRIYEAFVSSQKRADNLGLGLFVAQRIVANHGGEIRAEDSSLGKGARFVVRLPKAGSEGQGAGQDEAVPLSGVGTSKSVDDQPPQ